MKRLINYLFRSIYIGCLIWSWHSLGVIISSASPTFYYVNDLSTDGNVYTTAPGNDLNAGTNAAAPKLTLTNLLATYNLGPGDIVFIDTGVYAGYTVTMTNSGTASDPITFQGAPGIGSTVINRGDINDDVINVNGQFINFRDLTVTGGRDGFVLMGGSLETIIQSCVIRDNARFGFFDSVSNVPRREWIVRNSIIARNASGGVRHAGNRPRNIGLWENCVFWNNGGEGHVNTNNGLSLAPAAFMNSVFMGGAVAFYGNQMPSGDFNVFWNTAVTGPRRSELSAWIARSYISELNMPNSTYADPGFTDPEGMNFLPKPDSILIDFGNPASMAYTNEPSPNGGRLNAGAFGGTALAVASPTNAWLFTLSYTDGGGLSGSSNPLRWNHGAFTNGSLVSLDYSSDLGESWIPIVADIPVNDSVYNWDVTGLPPMAVQWRVVSQDDTNVWAASLQRASVNGFRVPYFVNDDSMNGAIYTTAVGSDMNDGLSPQTPMRTITNLLQRYNFGGYDTIYVDTGVHSNYTVHVPPSAAGSPASGRFRLQGSLNVASGGTVIDRGNPSQAIMVLSDAPFTDVKSFTLKGGNTVEIIDNFSGNIGFNQISALGFGLGAGGSFDVFRAPEVYFDGCIITGPGIGIRQRGGAGSGPVYVNNTVFWGKDEAIATDHAPLVASLNNSVVVGGQVFGGGAGTTGIGDYNILWNTVISDSFSSLYDLQRSQDNWWNSVVMNPLFADPDNGNFHPQSVRGRYDPGLDEWVVDAVHSPMIDFGDPALPEGDEPDPNGGRINVGAFGGTPWASKSQTNRWLQILSLSDGGSLSAPFDDQPGDTVRWIGGNYEGETVRIELSLDNGQTWETIESGVSGAAGVYEWANTNYPSSNNSLWRVVDEVDNDIKSESSVAFVFRNGPFVYYINNASTNDNVYTDAPGNDANTGTSPSDPKASLAGLLAAENLLPGDIVYIDTGTYTLPSTLTIGSLNSGTSNAFINIYGSTNYLAGGTVFNRNSTTQNAIVLNGDYWAIHDLRIRNAGTGLVLNNSTGTRLVRVHAYDHRNHGVHLTGASSGVQIEHSVFRNNWLDGVRVDNAAASAHLQHSVLWANTNAGLRVSSGSATITNSAVSAIGPTAYAYHAATANSIVGDYNNLQVADNGLVGFISSGTGMNRDIATLGAWHSLTGHETHSLSVDPLFQQPNSGNFRLQPASWLIDAGDPAADASAEPGPAGRVNIGLFGGTAEAEIGLAGPRLHAARPRAGGWLKGTGSFHWVAYDMDGDTVALDVSLDGGTTWSNIASGIAATNEWVDWDTTTVSDTPAALWRVTSEQDPGVMDGSTAFFSIRNAGPLSLYINRPDQPDGDEFTSAAGAATNWTARADAPLDSLALALQLYDLEPGDAIYIDTGTYVESSNPIVKRSQGGSAAQAVQLIGSPNELAGGTVIERDSVSAGSYGLQLAAADRVTVQDMTFSQAHHGIHLENANNNTFRDVRVLDQANHGIMAVRSTDNTFRSVLAAHNAGVGYRAQTSSSALWNHGVLWSNAGGAVSQNGGSLTVRNSVLHASGEGRSLYDLTTSVDLNSNFNNLWIEEEARTATVGIEQLGSVIAWQVFSGHDQRSLQHDPLFADPGALNFRPTSPAGRYVVAEEEHRDGAFTGDTSFSPLIDAGRPSDSFGSEPAPNGGRVNIGLYGNTAQASMSDTSPWLRTLTLNSGGTVRGTNDLHWIASEAMAGEDVAVEFSNDGGVSWDALAVVAATNEVYTFDTTLYGTVPEAQWRVRSITDPAVVGATESLFIVNNGPLTFYVNDAHTDGLVYTTAVGHPDNSGVSSNAPLPSVRAVFQRYSVRPGDTILVDTGEYELSESILLTESVAGVVTNRLTIQGSTNWAAGGTRLTRSDAGRVFDLDGADAVALRYLRITHAGTGVRVAGADEVAIEWVQVDSGQHGFEISNAQDVAMRHVSARGGTGSGVLLSGNTSGFTLDQAVLWDNLFGLNQNANTAAATVRHTVIGALRDGAYAYRRLPAATLDANFNNIYLAAGGRAGWVPQTGRDAIYRSVSRWVRDTGQDRQSLSHLPLFVDADEGDFRLASTEGYTDFAGGHVIHTETSPLIAAGDPSVDVAGIEPQPNGARVNIGMFGGSEWASLTPPTGSLTVISLNDGGRIEGTNAIHWVARGAVTNELVRVEYSDDDGVSWVELAAAVSATNGLYEWDTTLVADSALGRWRVSQTDDATLNATNETFFAVRNGPLSFFVNDVDQAGDVYTDSPGHPDNTGVTPVSPLDSVRGVIQRYDVEPGDTIWVDTGVYELPETLALGFFESGEPGMPLLIQGSTNEVAGGTRFVMTSGGSDPVIRLNQAIHVHLRHLNLEPISGAGLRLQGDSDHGLVEWVNVLGGSHGFDLTATDDVVIRHSSVREGSGSGLLLGSNARNIVLENGVLWSNVFGVNINAANASATVRNTVIGAFGTGRYAYRTLANNAWASDPSLIPLDSDYNNIYLQNGALPVLIPVNPVNFRFPRFLSRWTLESGQDAHSLTVDPLFVDAANGDFRLQSTAGRSSRAGGEVSDGQTSLLIDAGDPAYSVGAEPVPNGGRINIGQFGGSEWASKSPEAARLAVVNLDDGGWVVGDAAMLYWTAYGDAVTGTVSVAYSVDDGASWTPIASGVDADLGGVSWDTTGVDPTALGRWRVTLDGNGVSATNARPFAVRNVPLSFFVNDADTEDAVYTTAAGSAANTGISSNSPRDSITSILADYDLEPGDTIYVDTGDYEVTEPIEVDFFVRGASGQPLTIQGSTNEAAGGTRITRTTAGPVFRTDQAAYVVYRHLNLYPAAVGSSSGIRFQGDSDHGLIEWVNVIGGVNGFDLTTVDDVRIRHSSVRSGTGSGIFLGANARNIVFENGVLWSNTFGVNMNAANASATVRNSVIGAFGAGRYAYRTLANNTWANNPALIPLDSDYNNIYLQNGALPVLIPVNPVNFRFPRFLSRWTLESGQDAHSLTVDPLFVDAAGGDFRLQSTAGRSSRAGGEVSDEQTSLLIDAGDPAYSVGAEPVPHGGRINIGQFGGSALASKSPEAARLAVVNLNDGGWVAGDDAMLYWTAYGDAVTGTVSVAYSVDDGASWTTIASGLDADEGALSWDTTGVDPTALGRWRVTLDGNGVSATNARPFAVRNTALAFYVNDNGDLAENVYTSAIGLPTNTGATPDSPRDSIHSILADYDLEPGDTIFIDTGEYTLSDEITVDYFDRGVSGAPVQFQGSTNELAGGTRITRTTAGPIFRVTDDAAHVSFRHLNLQPSTGSGSSGIRFQSDANNGLVEWVNVAGGLHGFDLTSVTNAVIRHSSVRESTSSGLFLGANARDIVFESGVLWSNVFGVNVNATTVSATVRNTVIGAFGAGRYAYRTLANNAWANDPSLIPLDSDYNNIYLQGGAFAAIVSISPIPAETRTVSRWARDSGLDRRTLTVNPLFVDVPAGDFRLQSAAGRSSRTGTEEFDGQTSLLIDAGDPAYPVGAEPAPNGGRINIGQFGGSALASKSPTDGWLTTITLNDGGRIEGTNALYWVAGGAATNHFVTLEYSPDGGLNWVEIASGVSATAEMYDWDTSEVTSSILGRWRLTSEQDVTIQGQTDSLFAVRNVPLAFYVNDGDTTDTVYTSQPGDPGNTGVLPSTPQSSLQYIFDTYALEPGDTVYVDTGVYADEPVLVDRYTQGTETDRITIQGSTNTVAGGSVWLRTNPGAGSAGLRLNGTSGIDVRDMTFRSWTDGVWIDGNSADVQLIGVRSELNTQSGFRVQQATDISILNSIAWNNEQQGYRSQTGANVLLGNVVFWGNPLALELEHGQTTVRNSVLQADGAGNRIYNLAAPAQLTADFNNLVRSDGAYTAVRVEDEIYPTATDWRIGFGQDERSMSHDPLFVDVEAGNFHPLSVSGHFDQDSGQFVTNSVVHSPLIDAGDPAWSVGDEPMPNGGRINIGAYGGTPRASKSRIGPWLQVASFTDGGVVSGTNTLYWWAGEFDPGTTVSVEFSRDGGLTYTTLANGLPVTDQEFEWDASAEDPTVRGRWRVIEEGVATPQQSATETFFAIRNNPLVLYVNDTNTFGTVYTMAPGDPDNDGQSPETPLDSLLRVFDTYTVLAGDTIYVDTGVYAHDEDLVIGELNRGAAEFPIRIIGSTNDLAGGTVIVRSGEGPGRVGVRIEDTEYIELSHLRVRAAEHGLVVNNAAPVTLRWLDLYDNEGDGLRVATGAVLDVERTAVWNNTGAGVRLVSGAPAPQVQWAHGVAWNNARAAIEAEQGTITVSNSVLQASGEGAYVYRRRNLGSPRGDFNVLWPADGAKLAVNDQQSVDFDNLYAWQHGGLAVLTELHSVVVDPFFVDPSNGQFYLMSEAGRYDPDTGGVATDGVTSWAIDAGAFDAVFSDEPSPNGDRLNVGRYGNTPRASQTPDAVARRLLAVSFDDGAFFDGDQTLYWLAQGFDTNATVRLEYSVNAGADWETIATNVKARTEGFAWSVAPFPSSPAARWRVIDESDATIESASTATFTMRNNPFTFFVNDDDTTGNVYTTAPGSSANVGISSNAPLLELADVLERYTLLPGDTIYIDTGYYERGQTTFIDDTHMATAANPIRIIGSPHWPGTVLSRGTGGAFGSTEVLRLTDSDYWEVSNLTLEDANHGLVLIRSSHNTFNRLLVRDGGAAAVDIRAGSAHNRFTRSVLTRHQGIGLRQANVSGTHFDQGIIWSNQSHAIEAAGGSVAVSNSVLYATGPNSLIYNITAATVISADFNNLYRTAGALVGTGPDGLATRGVPQWNQARQVDWYSLAVDPLFADTAADDYHLRSINGRFDPGLGGFTNDAVHSPLIDMGDPARSVGVEEMPNGGRINIGLYGGTAQASRSREDAWLYPLTAASGGIILGTFPLNWGYGNIDSNETVRLEYSFDDGVDNWSTIASNVPINALTYEWESDQLDGGGDEIWVSSPIARWRVVREADTDLKVQTDEFFGLRNRPFTYFVNDGSTEDNVYTTAAGNDSNPGFLPEAPKATLASLFGDLRLEIIGEDKVFIDTGVYEENFTFSPLFSGEPGNPVVIQGSTNYLAGGTVFQRSGSGDIFTVDGDHLELRDVRFNGNHLNVRGDDIQVAGLEFLGGANLRITAGAASGAHDVVITNGELQLTGGSGFEGRRIDIHNGRVLVQNHPQAALRNLLVTGGSADAVAAANAAGLTLQNSTLATGGSAFRQTGSTTATLRNNILVADGASSFGIDWVGGTLDSDYNLIRNVNGAWIGRENGRQWERMLYWQAATGEDTHSFNANPLFVDAGGGDYRLQSLAEGNANHSPAIDAGDPAMPVGAEPTPHGGRINLGRYGGTDKAARSRTDDWLTALTVNDGGLLRGDQTLRWVAGNMSGNVHIEYSADGGSQWTNVATVAAETGAYTWDTTTVDDSFNARWRVVSADNPAIYDEVDQPIALRNNRADFFVNDGFTIGDVYSDAIGAPVNDGLSASAPLDSLQALLDQYDLTGGDVIYVDTGTYELTEPLKMIWSRGGHPDYGPVTIQGSTNLVAGGSVFVQAGSADGFDIKPTHVMLRDLTVRGAQRGFRFDGGEELVGERLFAYSNQTAIVAANVQDLTLRNLRLWDNTAGGVDLQNVQTALVEHVSYASDAPYGIKADSASSELTVQNSIFQVAANRVALDMPAPVFIALFLDYNVYDLAPDAVIWGSVDDLLPLQLTYGHDFRSALEPAGFVDATSGDFLLLSTAGRYDVNGPGWVTDGETAWAVDRANPASPFDQETDPDGGRANIGAFGNTEWASRGRDELALETRQFEEEVAIEADAVWPLVWSVLAASEPFLVDVQFSGNAGANWVDVATGVDVYDEYILWTNTPFFNTRSGLWRITGGGITVTNAGQMVTFDEDVDFVINAQTVVNGLQRVQWQGAWGDTFQVQYSEDLDDWINAATGVGPDQQPLFGPTQRGGDFLYEDVDSTNAAFRVYRIKLE